MQLKSCLPGLALLILPTLACAAECDRNFAGEWTRDVAGVTPDDAYRAEGSGWNDRIRVSVDAGRITVESFYFSRGDLQPPLKFTYLPGEDSTENVIMVGQGLQRQISTARWNDCRLVITSRFPSADPALPEGTVVQALWLEPSALVVETARDAAKPNRTVYRRAAPAGGK
jgi:hypothetical protein